MGLKMEKKVCSKCKRDLPSTENYFNKDKNRKDGLYPQCRECKQGRKIFAKEGFKFCSKCQRELPMNTDYFFKKKDNSDGLTIKCKECMGKEFTNKLTKIAKEGYKFCIKCNRELKATISYFPPDKMCKDGLRNVCRECGKDGHFMEEDYVPKKWWTEEENERFKELYPHYTNEELIEIHYPDLTLKTIMDKAYLLGVVKSDDTRKRSHKIQGEKLYGENHFQFGRELSNETKLKLSLSRKGKYVGEKSYWFGRKRSLDQKLYMSKIVKEREQWKGENNPRHIDPLKGERNGNWQGGISELYAHLRRNIAEWKIASIKSSKYKCVITGGEFDDIHHLYSFDSIVQDTLSNLNLSLEQSINLYTPEELKMIEQECLRIHMENIGVCLRRDVHILFHKIYGYGNNTLEQFKEFKDKYLNNELEEVN
jgi:hypothetical protein